MLGGQILSSYLVSELQLMILEFLEPSRMLALPFRPSGKGHAVVTEDLMYLTTMGHSGLGLQNSNNVEPIKQQNGPNTLIVSNSENLSRREYPNSAEENTPQCGVQQVGLPPPFDLTLYKELAS